MIRRFLRTYFVRFVCGLTLVMLFYLSIRTWFTSQREMRIGQKIRDENGEAGFEYIGPTWLPQLVQERSPFWRITFVSLEHFQVDRLPGEAPEPISSELLAEIGTLSRLHGLALTMRDVNDSNILHIAKLKTLRRLYLVHTGITDVGLQSLKELPSLKTLHVSETNTTRAGREALRKALPNCQIDPQP